MKGRILQLLRAEKGVVSGERLSADLGISRVSVWKHIKKLQEFGYPIAAMPKGYMLTHPYDALSPLLNRFHGNSGLSTLFQETPMEKSHHTDVSACILWA